jgi:hypothetical protein
MPVRKRTFVFVALALLVWSVAASGFAGYYYTQYTNVKKAFEESESLIIKIDVLMDYGNGTKIWHNQTMLVAGSTVFDALLTITNDVQFQTSAFGVFVTSINGVENVAEGTTGFAWLWYYWDTEKSEWTSGPVGADQYVLNPDGVIAWRYESYSF